MINNDADILLDDETVVKPIYTIGYGARPIDEFIMLLQKHHIDFLVDVRSFPYSKTRPEYSQNELSIRVAQNGIRYIFMGKLLGGRPADPTCYTEGKVDYEKCDEKPFYRNGIGHLRRAWERQLNVCLVCSEGKPQDCHRSKLIGETLRRQHIEVVHIDETGNIKPQQQVINLVRDGQLSMFETTSPRMMSRKVYYQHTPQQSIQNSSQREYIEDRYEDEDF